MLLELHIRDFALIDRVDIEFAPGMNVLTGETGAGKSIVVDALQLALGGRASADVVRGGAEMACIEAVFQLAEDAPVRELLQQMELLDGADPGHVILRRDVLETGRSRARINGHPVTVAQLLAVGEGLVDVHGQHDHQSLLRTANQLELLDAYGGPSLQAKRRRFGEIWNQLVTARRELEALQQGERERARRLDLVRFQIEEIDVAQLDEDEEEQLKTSQTRLAHLGRLQTETARLYTALSAGEEGVPAAADVLADAAHTVTGLVSIDPDLADTAQLLETAALQAREAASFLRTYGDQLEADPAQLEHVAARLAQIGDLKRKYGADVAEILAFADELRSELDNLERSDSREAELSNVIKTLDRTAADTAAALSAARHTAARNLERAVSAELEGLHMGPGRFSVSLEQQESDEGLQVGGKRLDATSSGIDKIEFLLSANPGEPARPLARIASGGELSRVALALKRCLIEVDAVPTLVFDEIDAGIGGETAQAVAARLGVIGDQRQVICVTHLAQIATVAGNHLHIKKVAADERTAVQVTSLRAERRVEEIARMLAGVLTASTLENARELLALAQKAKSAS